MEKRYLSGHGSIDARRCMAFQLLRCHPDNPQNAKSVTQFLREDPDQTNAYYVVRYLMNWGRVEHPELMNGETLDAIGSARDRWPSNHFLRNAHRRLSERLLKSA